jgi:hypothetical protein
MSPSILTASKCPRVVACIWRPGLQLQCQATLRRVPQPARGDRVVEISPAKSKWLGARAKVILVAGRAHLRSRHAARGWRGAVHFIAAWIAARHKS